MGGRPSPRAVHQCKQVSIFNYTRTWSHVMGADQELRSSTWDCKYIRCHPPPLLTWTVKWRKTSVCFCKTLSPQNMKTIFNELEYPIYNWSLNRQKIWRKIPWPNLFCLWSLSVFYPYRAWPVSRDSLHRFFFSWCGWFQDKFLRKYATGLQRNLHHPGRFNEGNIKIANKTIRLNLLADKKK